MRDFTLHTVPHGFRRQLPWWLAALAFAVLAVLATSAWQAADDQRRDAEGALRQLAAEAAAQAGRRLREAEAAALAADSRRPSPPRSSPPQTMPGTEGVTVATAAAITITPEAIAAIVVRARWFQPGDSGGEGADWVFGPWPQAATELSRKFEEAQALFRSGKLAECGEKLREVLVALNLEPDLGAKLSTNPDSPSLNPPASPTAANARPAGDRAPPSDPAISLPDKTEAFTTSGLPLKPLALRLRLALLNHAADAPNPANSPASNAAAEQKLAARELLEAATAFPSALTSALVEEAAAALEKSPQPQPEPKTEDIVRIASARQRAAFLENLRQALQAERAAVHAGARWIGENRWHLEHGPDGAITLQSLTALSHIARQAGFRSATENDPSGIPPNATTNNSGIPPGWTLRALRDGVDVLGNSIPPPPPPAITGPQQQQQPILSPQSIASIQSIGSIPSIPLLPPQPAATAPPPPERIMASATAGSWRVVAVCEDPALAFAALDRQRLRQRGLIGGAALVLTAALAAFLWALERQRRLNAMMSNFVAAVSHELRAPVASVGLLAERLHAGRVPEAAEQAKYHGLIEGECRRISATIENVLAFSRLERRLPARELELTDLRALVEDAARVFQAPAAERQVHLELTLPPDPVELEIDPTAIRQAVINLLDNALKFSPPQGTIHIRLEAEPASAPVAPVAPVGPVGLAAAPAPAYTSETADPLPITAACIHIRDHGPGIPAAESARIFDPFYRPGSELRRSTAGIGLGLAIVRAAALAHRGTVTHRPVTPVGTEFTLHLRGGVGY